MNGRKCTNILKFFYNSPSLYVCLRYITYGLQFINAILLAKYLGEYGFGIYSFMMLIMQYMSYSNLGISESLNSEYAICKSNVDKARLIWYNAWSINVVLNIFLLALGGLMLIVCKDIFSSYHFDDYGLVLLITCVTINLSKVYITFYRLQGSLIKLNVQQILPNALVFVFILCMKDTLTVSVISYLYLVGNAVSLLIFRWGVYYVPHFSFDKEIVIVLIKRGIVLLLYNLSFYLLTIIASSFVSIYYSVEDFGIYSFANTLVNGVVMAGAAFMFIFYPRLLNELANGTREQTLGLIRKIRDVYIVFIDLLSILSILGIMILMEFFPKYNNVSLLTLYSLLIIGRIINNASSGYATFLIARKKEKYLVFCGLLSVVIIAILGILIGFLNLDIKFIPIAVIIASLIYVFGVIRISLSFLGDNKSCIFSEVFGMNKWFVCCVVLLSIVLGNSMLVLFVGLMFYFILNFQSIKKALLLGIKVIFDRNVLKF